MLVYHFFVVTKLSLDVVTKSSFLWSNQTVITKLSPFCSYQIVMTKLSLPNCHYQIVLTKLTLPKINPSFTTSYRFISIIVRLGMRKQKYIFKKLFLSTVIKTDNWKCQVNPKYSLIWFDVKLLPDFIAKIAKVPTVVF